jgi:hypothetical protein
LKRSVRGMATRSKGLEKRKVACILKSPRQEFQERRRCDPNPR